MNLRKLGSSDIEVSEISLGSWLTYSGGVERERAKACVEAAFDVGITTIGIRRNDGSALISRSASRPSIFGMFRSSRIKPGRAEVPGSA